MPKIEAQQKNGRCVVRMAPDRSFSKYELSDWLYGYGENYPAALRDLANNIDKAVPTFKPGRIPHRVKAAARLRQSA